MTGDPNVYVSALTWVGEAPALAETGFDSTPLIAFAVLTVLGGVTVMSRRTRA